MRTHNESFSKFSQYKNRRSSFLDLDVTNICNVLHIHTDIQMQKHIQAHIPIQRQSQHLIFWILGVMKCEDPFKTGGRKKNYFSH